MATKKDTQQAHAAVDALLHAERGSGVEHLKEHHYKLIIILVVIFAVVIGFGAVTILL